MTSFEHLLSDSERAAIVARTEKERDILMSLPVDQRAEFINQLRQRDASEQAQFMSRANAAVQPAADPNAGMGVVRAVAERTHRAAGRRPRPWHLWTLYSVGSIALAAVTMGLLTPVALVVIVMTALKMKARFTQWRAQRRAIAMVENFDRRYPPGTENLANINELLNVAEKGQALARIAFGDRLYWGFESTAAAEARSVRYNEIAHRAAVAGEQMLPDEGVLSEPVPVPSAATEAPAADVPNDDGDDWLAHLDDDEEDW